MAELMRFPLETGGTVVVEVADDEPGVARASRATQTIRQAGASFSAALSGVRDAAASALGTFRNMPHRPDEITVEFGIRLNAEAGAVIARTGTEGHIQVTLHWKRDQNLAAEPASVPAPASALLSTPTAS